jgi:Metallo-beta-lactamase superfamily
MQSVKMFGLADDETDVRELAVPCYVIEHPRGRMLWDGGLPSALASTPGWQQDGAGGAIRLDRTLPQQLAAMDLGMDAFDYVAFSHMHFDHVGVANELGGGTLLIQRAEHDAAFGSGTAAPDSTRSYTRGCARRARRSWTAITTSSATVSSASSRRLDTRPAVRSCSCAWARRGRSCFLATCIISPSAANGSACRRSTRTLTRPPRACGAWRASSRKRRRPYGLSTSWRTSRGRSTRPSTTGKASRRSTDQRANAGGQLHYCISFCSA